MITGSTGGIGTALCKKLHEEGCRVVSNFRCKEKAVSWQNSLKELGVAIDMIQGDVTNFDAVEQTIQHVEKEIGPIDILINNAGIAKDARFAKMTKSDWDAVINTNLNGVFNCTRHVINGMIERRYGRIINISSVNGQKGQFGLTNYSATKAGIHGFTKSLAVEPCGDFSLASYISDIDNIAAHFKLQKFHLFAYSL